MLRLNMLRPGPNHANVKAQFDPLVACEGPHGMDETLPWDWCGRGTSHVQFAPQERVPLEEGRHLGHGVHGPVFETQCLGRTVAWKRKFVRKAIGAKELGEIGILKKLRHLHIINLVGTYTKGPYLGLLLFPVATCDLASYLEDLDHVQSRPSGHPERIASDQRLMDFFAPFHDSLWQVSYRASKYLPSLIACLASAINYLHASKVKHKDLKPANILLGGPGQLWLTDFGASSEFADFAHSATEGGERGTPKYFAPEVAAYEKVGRSADMFSLGCVLLEILAVCAGYSLEELKSHRPDKDHSFQANLQNVLRWFDTVSVDRESRSLMTEVRMMLRQEPRSRPTAQHVFDTIGIVGEESKGFSWPCCRKSFVGLSSFAYINTTARTRSALTITFGNTWEGQRGDRHRWSFFVWPSDLEVIDKIWCYLHPSCREPQRVLSEHPFQFYSDAWGRYEISFAILLKPHLTCHNSNSRLLVSSSMSWLIQFDEPIEHTTLELPYGCL